MLARRLNELFGVGAFDGQRRLGRFGFGSFLGWFAFHAGPRVVLPTRLDFLKSSIDLQRRREDCETKCGCTQEFGCRQLH